MKKKIVFFIFIMLFSISNVYASSNPYSMESSYGTNCTWYAWQQAHDRAGVSLPGWGNANTWLDSAKKAGYETGYTPRAKSIVVWAWSSYGHVGYVESVSGNSIYVWDSQRSCINKEDPQYKTCIENSVSEESDRECNRLYGKSVACEYSNPNSNYGGVMGYIYLNKIPSGSTSNQNIQTSNTSQIKKDNDATLKSLKISNIDFEFKSDVLKYELDIDSNIDTITIETETNSAKAKVDGNKEYKLNIGLNTINITVTAEDDTQKVYELLIKRKDNNNYLKTLTISNLDFKFNKKTLNYNFTVKDIDNIKINAKPESEYAKIKGTGKFDINEGLNTFKIKVTAENGDKKIYTINITKEKNIIPYLIIGISGIILISIIIIFIIFKKKKKNKIKEDKNNKVKKDKITNKSKKENKNKKENKSKKKKTN